MLARTPRTKRLRIALLAAITAGLGAYGTAYGALVETTQPQALMVTETAAGSQTQANGTIGPITNEGGNSGNSGSTAPIANADALAIVPANSGLDTVYTSDQDAQNAVNSYLQPYLPQIASAMKNVMVQNGTGISMGYFTYIQQVQIASPNGTPTNAQIFATVLVEPNGNYQFLGTNVNTNTINLLYAVYEQSQNAYYLPSGWTLPNAGETRWELFQITSEGNSLVASAVPVDGSIWHTIQDNGAYNGVTSGGNGGKQTINYTTAVASWIKNQIQPLMNQNNASFAIAAYDQEVKAARNSSGQPIMALDVENRKFTGNCTNTSLENSGQYGYLLNVTQNNYIVQSSGNYYLASQTQSNTISPTQSFNQTAALPSGTTEGQAQDDIAFPIAPYQGQIVNYLSGNPIPESDYVYVAPLQSQNNTDAETSEVDSYYGWVNVCINPNQEIYTYESAPYYQPQLCFKGQCSSAGNYQAITYSNIAPFSINGQPQYWSCSGLNCVLQNDIDIYENTPQGNIGMYYISTSTFLQENIGNYNTDYNFVSGQVADCTSTYTCFGLNGVYAPYRIYLLPQGQTPPAPPSLPQTIFIAPPNPITESSGYYGPYATYNAYKCTSGGCTYTSWSNCLFKC